MRSWVSFALLGLAVAMFFFGLVAAFTGTFIGGIILMVLSRGVFWFSEKLERKAEP